MTALLERVFKQREKQDQAIHENEQHMRDELLELAIKDAFGEEVTDDDANNLSALLYAQKLSDDEYGKLVAAIARVPAAVGSHEYVTELHEQKAAEFEEAQRQMHHARMVFENAQRRVNFLAHLPTVNATSQAVKQLREDVPMVFDESGEPIAVLRDRIEKHKTGQREHDAATKAKAAAATFDKMNGILARLGLKQFPAPGATE
ncbi:hypothetical protein Enr13x_28020 [Stieleria neptunia]|uniref:Uncharacterized protein n=1 Tax=Stieleria neptunia TaxID=2527979 RepID=A0A518HQ33_9BACT|nr:hypothetical protein [Stieleria neptunia]QDV42950.1 hypothetical protein Enr13x_28020 [Stieleria neptunia]